MAIGLSVGYDTWPLTDWNHAFVIGWSKYRLGLTKAPLHYGFTWLVGIPTVFHTPVTVPLHRPNGRHLSAVRAVQGYCERVYCFLRGRILTTCLIADDNKKHILISPQMNSARQGLNVSRMHIIFNQVSPLLILITARYLMHTDCIRNAMCWVLCF